MRNLMHVSASNFNKVFNQNWCEKHLDNTYAEYDSAYYRALAAWYHESADGRFIKRYIASEGRSDETFQELQDMLSCTDEFLMTSLYIALHGKY